MTVWSPTDQENSTLAKFARELTSNELWDYRPAPFLKVLPFTNVLHLGMTMVLLEMREKRLGLRRRKLPAPKHQVIKLSDGGTICWLEYTATPETATRRTLSACPVVVLMPTFSGLLDYVEQMIHVCVLDFEWTVIVLNRRGTHCALTTPPLHILGNDDDTKVAFELIRDRFCPCGGTNETKADADTDADAASRRRRPLLAIGYSAGGSFLMRFLGKHQPDYVTGAVSISGGFHAEMYDHVPAPVVNLLVEAFIDKPSPLIPARATNARDRGGSFILSLPQTALITAQHWFGARSKKHLQQQQQQKQQQQHNEQVAVIRRKMKQMGQAGSMHAFVQLESMLHTPDSKQFMHDSSMQNWIPKIASVPTLVINAEDDIICRNPTAYRRVLTDKSTAASRSCVLVVTRQGGHCLFAAGGKGTTCKSARQISWADFAAIQFFLRLLQVHQQTHASAAS